MPSVFCCPKCGNKNLLSTTETKTQTHGKNYSAGQGCLGFLLFGPLGLLCGGCGQNKQTTTTNTTYWICPDCGHKFENPDDIRKKIESYKTPTFALVMTVIGLLMAICFSMVFSSLDKSIAMLTAGCSLGFSVLMGVIIELFRRTEGKKLQNQLDEMEREMNRFKNE